MGEDEAKYRIAFKRSNQIALPVIEYESCNTCYDLCYRRATKSPHP